MFEGRDRRLELCAVKLANMSGRQLDNAGKAARRAACKMMARAMLSWGSAFRRAAWRDALVAKCHSE